MLDLTFGANGEGRRRLHRARRVYMITALVADDADDVGPTGKHAAVATASVDDDATIE